jgi:hypothetical protein
LRFYIRFDFTNPLPQNAIEHHLAGDNLLARIIRNFYECSGSRISGGSLNLTPALMQAARMNATKEDGVELGGKEIRDGIAFPT